MKAKAKPKTKDKAGVTSVVDVVQPSQTKKKAVTTNIHKQSEIEIHHWLNYNADKLSDIILGLQNIQKGLRQVASLVRAHYTLK